jgi:ABC-2 type transport system ATP-binding protein
MSTVLRKLQREVFVLSLRHAVTEAPQLAGFDTVLREDGDVEVAVDSYNDVSDLFAELGKQGISVVSMRNKSSRLEELFIGLVESKQPMPALEAG